MVAPPGRQARATRPPRAYCRQPGFDCEEKGKKGTTQTTGYSPLFQRRRVLSGETEPGPHPISTYATTDGPQRKADARRQASTMRRLFRLIPHFVVFMAPLLWLCHQALGRAPAAVPPHFRETPVSPGRSFHTAKGRPSPQRWASGNCLNSLSSCPSFIKKFNKITIIIIIIIIKTKAYWSCFCSTFHSLFSCHSLESDFFREIL